MGSSVHWSGKVWGDTLQGDAGKSVDRALVACRKGKEGTGCKSSQDYETGSQVLLKEVSAPVAECR